MTETLTRLVQGLKAEYTPAQWDGKDTSGVRVVGKTVLVLMDEVAEVRESGIELPVDYRERMNASCETGVLVAVSPGAFLLNEDMTPWIGEKPKPGDRVYIEKYAGKQIRGRDSLIYRLMDYGCIGATYEPDEPTSKGFQGPSRNARITFAGDSGAGAMATIVVTAGAHLENRG